MNLFQMLHSSRLMAALAGLSTSKSNLAHCHAQTSPAQSLQPNWALSPTAYSENYNQATGNMVNCNIPYMAPVIRKTPGPSNTRTKPPRLQNLPQTFNSAQSVQPNWGISPSAYSENYNQTTENMVNCNIPYMTPVIRKTPGPSNTRPKPTRLQNFSRTTNSDGRLDDSPTAINQFLEEHPKWMKGSKDLLELSYSLHLHFFMCNYIIPSKQHFLELGFPVQSSVSRDRAIVFMAFNPNDRMMFTSKRYLNVYAKEFTPRNNYFFFDRLFESLKEYERVFKKTKCNLQDVYKNGTKRRTCDRCMQDFFVSSSGEYLTTDRCTYHWGKLEPNKMQPLYFTCCNGHPSSKGCSTCELHVWAGVSVGFNGPFGGFVKTCPRENPSPDNHPDIYGIDCEMCYTKEGMELVRVSVLAPDGNPVYDSLVYPEGDIIDYNSRFSGVSVNSYNSKPCAKYFKEVQNDLLGFIKEDTILVGHTLNSDLRALKIIHNTCVDVSLIFPHYLGLPHRYSLKTLASIVLKRSIQDSPNGHDSCEDAKASMDLMLYKIKQDFGVIFTE